MGKLSPLANAVRKQYNRQYRARQQKVTVGNPTSSRDLRYWERKARKLIDDLRRFGHHEQADLLENCPSGAEFDTLTKIIDDLDLLKT